MAKRPWTHAETAVIYAILEPTWSVSNAPGHLIDRHEWEIPAIRSPAEFSFLWNQYHRVVDEARGTVSPHAHALVHALAGRLIDYVKG